MPHTLGNGYGSAFAWQQEQQTREWHMEAWHWMHSSEPEEYNEEYDRYRGVPKRLPTREARRASPCASALETAALSSVFAKTRHPLTLSACACAQQVHAAACGRRGARSQLPRGTRTAAAPWQLGILAGPTRVPSRPFLRDRSPGEVAQGGCAGGRISHASTCRRRRRIVT